MKNNGKFCQFFKENCFEKHKNITKRSNNRTQVTLQLKMELIIFDKASNRCSGTTSNSNERAA